MYPLTNLLITLSTLLAPVLAAAFPDNTFTSLPSHGEPYCTPTGPAVCNFAMTRQSSSTPALFDGIIYNRDCVEIGRLDNQTGTADLSVDGALPFVVVVNFLNVQFWYAGAFYSAERGDCVYYDGEGGRRVWQCAFDC